MEIDIAGQGTEEVHDAVDAKVVAMHTILDVADISRANRLHLVQRYLTYTVDGVVGVVDDFGHTVLGALHHHTATEDTAEVGTLDGVHRATGIARKHTVLFPVGAIRRSIGVEHRIIRIPVNIHALKDRQHLIGCNGGTYSVGLARNVGTLLQALVADFVVSLLTLGESFVLRQGNRILDVIEVRTVVGDVQLSVAIDKRQVAVAIQTAHTTTTNGDEVAVIDIVDGSCGIAEHRGGVGINLGGTRGGVTAGEHSIVDDDAFLVDICLAEGRPCCGISRLVAQIVQIGRGNIYAFVKFLIADGDSAIGFTPRLDQDLAVLRQELLTTVGWECSTLIFIIVALVFAIITHTSCWLFSNT